MSEGVVLTVEDPRAADVRALVDLLDVELYARYPEAVDIEPPDLAQFTTPTGLFVVARVGGAVVACGAIVRVDAETAEVKRMFVHPDHRGRGLARAVIAELEKRARAGGYRRLRLETGKRQPEAIALYRAVGYRETARYAPWENDALSVCFEKQLGSERHG